MPQNNNIELNMYGDDLEESGRRVDFEIVAVEKSITVQEVGGEGLVTVLPLDHFGDTADTSWIGRIVQLLRLRVKQEKIDEIAEKMADGWIRWELKQEKEQPGWSSPIRSTLLGDGQETRMGKSL